MSKVYLLLITSCLPVSSVAQKAEQMQMHLVLRQPQIYHLW
jgi:hypothetical protein